MATPVPCSHAAMANYANSKVILLNPGNYPGYSNYTNITYTWQTNAWTQVSTLTNGLDASGPTPRADFGMAYDGTRMVMFGGHDGTSYRNDTWYWNGTAWSLQNPTTKPFARMKHKMTYLSNNTTLVMFGGTNDLTPLQETWVLTSGNWTQLSPATSPSARYDFAMAASATQVVLFGGKNTNSELNDTWIWNGTTWTQQTTTGSPSVRSEAVMAYDASTSDWVLFGGRDSSGPLGDTWLYRTDTNTWTKRTPNTSPSIRAGAQMAYDSSNGRVMLFGGNNTVDALSDVWYWSKTGNTWAQLI